MRSVLILALAVAGCATAPKGGGSSGTTRYRVGDYVVYRFTSEEVAPVELREQVVKVDGDRLTLDVTALHKGEKRHWVQVVTDRPENRHDEVVDELYEFIDGQKIRVSNKDNADLYRLYKWTFPPLGTGERSDLRNQTYPASIAGTSYECHEEKGRIPSEALAFEFSNCPGFLWTLGPARVVSDDGELLWAREVIEAGNVREPVRRSEPKPASAPAEAAEQPDILP